MPASNHKTKPETSKQHYGNQRSDPSEIACSCSRSKRREVKKGGIIIPDTAKEKPQEGKVVALGTGKGDDDGKNIEFTVKKGDKVLITKYGGTEIKIDGETYLIMREDDILGIIG